MTGADIAQILTSMASLLAVVFGYLNSRAIREVHLATNSMKDALVAGAGREGVTEGLRQGAAIAAVAEAKKP